MRSFEEVRRALKEERLVDEVVASKVRGPDGKAMLLLTYRNGEGEVVAWQAVTPEEFPKLLAPIEWFAG